MSDNGDSYWDTPGAKAAAAAQSAKSADDYWSAAGVEDAERQSTAWASEFEFWQWMLAEGRFPGPVERNEAIAKRDERQKELRDEGYYFDPMPDDYVSLLAICREAGHNWKLLTSPVYDHSTDEGVPVDKPSAFSQNCLIVWYYDRNWNPYCVPWDADKVRTAIRDYGA